MNSSMATEAVSSGPACLYLMGLFINYNQRQTLVFMWNSALRKKFSFSGDFW